jgi:hypothetical protein
MSRGTAISMTAARGRSAGAWRADHRAVDQKLWRGARRDDDVGLSDGVASRSNGTISPPRSAPAEARSAVRLVTRCADADSARVRAVSFPPRRR